MSRAKWLKLIIASYTVVVTYSIWALKAYQGEPINWAFVALAVIITIAGAMVVFGEKRMSAALDMTTEMRGLAKEVKEMKQERDEPERE